MSTCVTHDSSNFNESHAMCEVCETHNVCHKSPDKSKLLFVGEHLFHQNKYLVSTMRAKETIKKKRPPKI